MKTRKNTKNKSNKKEPESDWTVSSWSVVHRPRSPIKPKKRSRKLSQDKSKIEKINQKRHQPDQYTSTVVSHQSQDLIIHAPRQNYKSIQIKFYEPSTERSSGDSSNKVTFSNPCQILGVDVGRNEVENERSSKSKSNDTNMNERKQNISVESTTVNCSVNKVKNVAKHAFNKTFGIESDTQGVVGRKFDIEKIAPISDFPIIHGLW